MILLPLCLPKKTIRDGGSTALYTVDTAETADTINTVDTIDTVDTVYTNILLYTA